VLGGLPICCIFVLDQLICRPNGAGSSFITTRASNRISSIPASKAMSSAKSRSVNTFSPRVQPQHPLCMVRFINQSMDTVLQTGLRLFCILGSHHSLPETNQMWFHQLAHSYTCLCRVFLLDLLSWQVILDFEAEAIATVGQLSQMLIWGLHRQSIEVD